MSSSNDEVRMKRGGKKATKPDKSALVVARQALSAVQQLRSARELKRFQFSSQITNYLAGVVTFIGNVAQGVGSGGRVGEEIRARKLTVRGKLYSLVPSNSSFRVVVFIDRRQIINTTPSTTLLLAADTSVALYNTDYDRRFQIVKDSTFTLNNCFLNQDVATTLEWELDLGNCLMSWNSAGQIVGNGLYCAIVSDVADAASAVTKPAIGDTATYMQYELDYFDD